MLYDTNRTWTVASITSFHVCKTLFINKSKDVVTLSISLMMNSALAAEKLKVCGYTLGSTRFSQDWGVLHLAGGSLTSNKHKNTTSVLEYTHAGTPCCFSPKPCTSGNIYSCAHTVKNSVLFISRAPFKLVCRYVSPNLQSLTSGLCSFKLQTFIP